MAHHVKNKNYGNRDRNKNTNEYGSLASGSNQPCYMAPNQNNRGQHELGRKTLGRGVETGSYTHPTLPTQRIAWITLVTASALT